MLIFVVPSTIRRGTARVVCGFNSVLLTGSLTKTAAGIAGAANGQAHAASGQWLDLR
jgi:hypothetical protein